jgi:hypothetical protein
MVAERPGKKVSSACRGVSTGARKGRRGGRRTVRSLDVVPRLSLTRLANEVLDPQSEHQPIQQPMHNLEPSLPSAEHRRTPPHVPRLPLLPRVFDDDVGNLEDSEREGVFAVLADGLEDDGEVSRVFSVQELEVLVVGALRATLVSDNWGRREDKDVRE